MAPFTVSRQGSIYSQESSDSQLCSSCSTLLRYLEKDESLKRTIFEEFRWALFGNGRSIRTLQKNSERGCVACILLLESLSELERLLLIRSRRGHVTTRTYMLETGGVRGHHIIKYDHGWKMTKTTFESNTTEDAPGERETLESAFQRQHNPSATSIPSTVREGENLIDIIVSYPLCKKDLQKTTVKEISLQLTIYKNISQENEGPLVMPMRKDEEIWSRAKRWLHECMETEDHSACRIQKMAAELPTRLIYVPKPGKALRLRLTRKLKRQSGIKYIALSHCWGKTPMPLVATRENLKALLINIPYDGLSKTFQDAITATQRLGFRYIWIDSLCILQGDQEDWLAEASRMASVYSRCTLNLVAADGPDGSFGCFPERGGKSCETSLISFEGKKFQCSPDIRNYLARTAAASRSWCFQETFLSPRSLYLCKSQLFWECRVARAHESLPLFRPGQEGWTETPLRASVIKLGGLTERSEIMTEWLRLTARYSGTAVTFQKDKLFAISGIARFFDEESSFQRGGRTFSLLDSGYLAGMWGLGFEFQLLWYVPHDARRPRNEYLLAPSWSWASVDGAVWHRFIDAPFGPGKCNLREDFEIVDCSTNPATSDIYGEAHGGALTVRCAPLERIHIYGTETHFTFRDMRRGTVYFDSSDSSSWGLFMLPVMFENNKTWGLVVRRRNKAKDIYRRVGLYRMKSLGGANKEKRIMVERPSRITITII